MVGHYPIDGYSHEIYEFTIGFNDRDIWASPRVIQGPSAASRVKPLRRESEPRDAIREGSQLTTRLATIRPVIAVGARQKDPRVIPNWVVRTRSSSTHQKIGYFSEVDLGRDVLSRDHNLGGDAFP